MLGWVDLSEQTGDAREHEPIEDAARQARHASKSLRNGLISLALLVVLVVGLLLAVPGLKGVGDAITRMSPGWVAAGVVLEVLSCAGYVLAFLQVFERAPIRFGARVALSELAFGAAASLGGAGEPRCGHMAPGGEGCTRGAGGGALRRPVLAHQRDQRDHADPPTLILRRPLSR
jgi:hypothetical protein